MIDNNNNDNNNIDNGEVSTPPKMIGHKNAITIVVAILCLVTTFVVGIFVGNFTSRGIAKDQPLLNEIYNIAKQYYYEDITKDEFKDLLAIGMTNAFDPYSGLILKNAKPKPKYGIKIDYDINSVKTIRFVDEDMPFDGILARGDIITHARFNNTGDYVEVKHMTKNYFVKMLDNSTSVSFKADREGVEIVTPDRSKDFATRQTLATYMDVPAYEGVGYVHLYSFEDNAIRDFMRAMYEFEQSGNHIMLLDIRDNPGGSTDELAMIANNFIASQNRTNLVINIKTRQSASGEKTNAKRYTLDDGVNKITNTYIGDKVKRMTGKDFKLVVLANGNSASASEAFIGNIMHYMDRDDYLLLGEDAFTYGKGIAQADFKIKSNTDYILHLTIGKYFVLGPKGGSYENEEVNIHGVGYPLDNTNIKVERKANILEEDAVIKACEMALSRFA